MNYDSRLSDLKKNLDKAKSLRYQAEARLEQLENQRKLIIEELEELGIDPENLEEEIEGSTEEIERLFLEADKNLPMDLIKGD